MKNFKNLFIFLLSVFSINLLISCDDKDKKNEENLNGSGESYKVLFKAEVAPKGKIRTVVYGVDSAISTQSSIEEQSWNKELVTKKGDRVVTFSVGALGEDKDSTLKVEIWVDGKLKKESHSKGEILSATASLSLD